MSPSYDDEEFLELLEYTPGDEWVGSAPITAIVGCGMLTANRRLVEIAAEEDLQIYDPETAGGAGATVSPDAFETVPKRAMAFRRRPADPESAPATPGEAGYTNVQDLAALVAGAAPGGEASQ